MNGSAQWVFTNPLHTDLKHTANRVTSNRRMLSYLLSSETAGKWILLVHKEIMEAYIKYLEVSNNPMGNTAEN